MDNIFEEYNISHDDRHVFSTSQEFHSFVQESFTRWQNSGAQYIGVLEITKEVMPQIDQIRSELPLLRLYHDTSFDRLVIKFVGVREEIAIREFGIQFTENCLAIGITRYDLLNIGAGRKQSADGFRHKEPNDSFGPKNTRPSERDLPTMAIEVDRSENLSKLRNDAHFWLTRTDRKARVVILIHIQADNKMLHVEHWELAQRDPSGICTDASPAKLQEFDLGLSEETIFVNPSSASLDITTELLFDSVPSIVTKDTLTIGTDRLIAFAREYFGKTK